MVTGGPRVSGHALPENLVAHLGVEEAGALSAARVVRIAVHPAARRRGLGRALLAATARRAAEEGFDYVGSIFGASPELVSFWRSAGYVPLRLSSSRGARSGEHSLLVATPVSDRARTLVAALERELARELPHALADTLRDVPPELLCACGASPPAGPDGVVALAVPFALDDDDVRALVAYAFGPRPYDSVVRPLFALAHLAMRAGSLGHDREGRLVVAKVCERAPWAEVAARLGYPSVKVAMRALKEIARGLVIAHGGAVAKREKERFGRAG
jgi:tRNA(Met) cytidine acetyltransferase